MSESNNVSNGVPATAPEASTKPTGGEVAAAAADMSSLSGAEAVALANESKATGKSIEQLFQEKKGKIVPGQGSKPAEQSTQDALKEAVTEAKRKLKIKDGDQEVEVDEDEVLSVYKSRKSHQQAANKELQEGKAARKQAEEFISMMRDPEQFWQVAEKLGHKNTRELAEKLLVRQLEDEMMDPRDRELRDAKARIKSIEDMERKQREAVEAKRADEMKQKYVKDYETQFIDALKTTEVPQNKDTIARMAKYISQSAKANFKMTPKEAAQLVKEDIQQAQMRLISETDGEMLLKLLGDETAKKILQARGAQVKQTGFNTPTQQGERRIIEKTGEGKTMTHKEWREFNRPKSKKK